MSLNLPPYSPREALPLSPRPLFAAAQQLWSQLLTVPVQFNQLTRFSCAVSSTPSTWALMRTAEQLGVQGRFYWQDRQQQLELVGLGIAHDVRDHTQQQLSCHWSDIQAITASTDALFMGGLSFNGRNGTGHWEGFDALRFALPVVELRRRENQWQLSVQLFAECAEKWHQQFNTAREILHQVSLMHADDTAASIPAVVERTSLTSADQWRDQVRSALRSIQAHRMDKVVLARATAFAFQHPTSLAALAQRWQARTPGTFGFAVNFGDASFVGFSPERLLRQQGLDIATEALAGTQPRGVYAEQDAAYEQVLRYDDKLIHEHKLVADFIALRLKPFSKHSLSDAQVGILKLANVQHRQAGYRAQLHSVADTPALLQALFPTPAVCGLPTQLAFDCIAKDEPVQRGWYAGAVGVIGEHCSEFSVAIRSGLLQDDCFINYAGAGIVQGSDADAEWQELNDKVAIVERLLN